MPEAVAPAAARALAQAGRAVKQMDAIKTHNPFALNDLLFARRRGVDVMKMNNLACSLVWGHPQAPMGTRAVIELIEELALRAAAGASSRAARPATRRWRSVLEVGDA